MVASVNRAVTGRPMKSYLLPLALIAIAAAGGWAVGRSARKSGLTPAGAFGAGMVGAVMVVLVELSLTLMFGADLYAMSLPLAVLVALLMLAWLAVGATQAGWDSLRGGMRLRQAIVLRSLAAYLVGVAAVAVQFAVVEVAGKTKLGEDVTSSFPVASAFVLGLMVSIGPYLVLLLVALVMASDLARHPYAGTAAVAVAATAIAAAMGIAGLGAVSAAAAALAFMAWNLWRPLRAYAD